MFLRIWTGKCHVIVQARGKSTQGIKLPKVLPSLANGRCGCYEQVAGANEQDLATEIK